MEVIRDDYWTTKEAAQQLRSTPATLRRWRKKDYGPPMIKVGGTALYSKQRMKEWLAALPPDGKPVPAKVDPSQIDWVSRILEANIVQLYKGIQTACIDVWEFSKIQIEEHAKKCRSNTGVWPNGAIRIDQAIHLQNKVEQAETLLKIWKLEGKQAFDEHLKQITIQWEVLDRLRQVRIEYP